MLSNAPRRRSGKGEGRENDGRGERQSVESADLDRAHTHRPSAANQRTRTEEPQTITDDEAPVGGRSLSTTTMSSKRHGTPLESQKPRESRTSKAVLKHSSPAPRVPPKKRKAGEESCRLCEYDEILWKESRTTAMLQCEIPECGLWWHHWCLMTLQGDEDRAATTESIIFSPQVGNKEHVNLIFICPECTRSPDRAYVKGASQAMSTFLDTMNRLRKGDRVSESGSVAELPEVPETPNPMISSSAAPNPSQPQTSQQAMDWPDLEMELFEPARLERLRGYNKSEVSALMWRLDQSISNYARDTSEVMQRFKDDEEYKSYDYKPRPLGSWPLIDPSSSIISGMPWYNSENANNLARSHAPITAALREVFGIPGDMPLAIDTRFHDLAFGKVYVTLIWWFAMDVLLNKIDIYELPNMKPLRVMMSAVKGFADERWPKQGLEALQEVELRTWQRPQFQAALLENRKFLIGKLDAFLEPMTRGYEYISKFSHPKHDLIEALIKLWSYFQSLRGTFVDIQPKLGDPFDPDLFQLADEFTMLDPEESFVVSWIIRRGFAYHGIDGALVVREKAIVMVEQIDVEAVA